MGKIIFKKNIDEAYLNSVRLSDLWMWESNGSSVMSNNIRYLILSNILFDHFAQFERCLFGINSVRLESSLNIEKHSEMFIGCINTNNVHLTERESWVSSVFAINLDESSFIFDNLDSILSIKSVFQSLLEKNVKWNALSEFVWTWRRSGTVHSLQ